MAAEHGDLSARRRSGRLLTFVGLRRGAAKILRELGVIEAGALADLLLVNGDPVADIQLLANPEKNLAVIVKDGRIYKNTLR